MSPVKAAQFQAEFTALTTRAGLVVLEPRTRIVLAGADRVRFLHNLCTNDIRKLTPGSGCEAFLTNVQGKTIGHVFVLATDDELLLDTVGNQAETILKHLDHYLVSEKVELADESASHAWLLLAGPAAEAMLSQVAGDIFGPERLSHVVTNIGDTETQVVRADLAGPIGFLLRLRRDELSRVRERLLAAGAEPVGLSAFEAARVAWGFPWFDRDITAQNLPQEVARDRQAISFIKGCYLGQETVARIDALGHVNKTLVGLHFFGRDVPAAGLELTCDGQSAGNVTSAAYSPTEQRAIALAYVRRGKNTPGIRLSSDAGEAEVVALPATLG